MRFLECCPPNLTLSHSIPDCTELWKQELISRRLYWRCKVCEAIAYHSINVAEAAIREHQVGGTLRKLANAGDFLNLSESEEPRQW